MKSFKLIAVAAIALVGLVGDTADACARRCRVRVRTRVRCCVVVPHCTQVACVQTCAVTDPVSAAKPVETVPESTPASKSMN